MNPDTLEDDTLPITSTDAVVHLEYTPSTLPSLEEVAGTHGDGQWTRFVCISDTHCRTYDVPEGDVLLHSGDLTKTGREKEMETTMKWLCALPHAVKVVIAGNHDLTLHRDWYPDNHERWHAKPENSDAVYELLTGPTAKAAGIIYLEDSKAIFRVAPDRREWSIYGSPWSPYFCNWAFNYRALEAERIVGAYENADILMTHGPPRDILDQTSTWQNVGCPILTKHLASGRLRPRLHVFGHIHEAHGAHIHTWQDSRDPSDIPEVQNDINYPIVLTEDDSDHDMKRVEKIREATQKCKARERELGEKDGIRRTVFVNAATYPQGRNRWRDGQKTAHGGPRFRPVVVDLRDDMPSRM